MCEVCGYWERDDFCCSTLIEERKDGERNLEDGMAWGNGQKS